MDNKYIGIVLILIAGGLLLYQADLPFRIRIKPGVTPAVVVPESCRVPVDAVRSMRIEAKDAAELAAYFEAFARTLDADAENLVGSAESVRQLNIRSGKLCLDDKDIRGKYPGLAARIDDIIAAGIGSRKLDDGTFEPVPVTKTTKQNLAQALRAIAWAVKQ